MRGKKVKRLRRLSEALSKEGMPNVQYQDKALNAHKPTRRTRLLYDCTRLIYKNLKKMAA